MTDQLRDKIARVVEAGMEEYLREDLPEDGLSEAQTIAKHLIKALGIEREYAPAFRTADGVSVSPGYRSETLEGAEAFQNAFSYPIMASRIKTPWKPMEES